MPSFARNHGQQQSMSGRQRASLDARHRRSSAGMSGLMSSMSMRRTASTSLLNKNEHSVLGSSLGARKSSRVDYVLPDGSLPTPGEIDLDFHPTDIVNLTILSRCVEPLRFTVGPDILGEIVTQESLNDAYHGHVAFLRQRVSMNRPQQHGHADASQDADSLIGATSDAGGNITTHVETGKAAEEQSSPSTSSLYEELQGDAGIGEMTKHIETTCRIISGLHSRDLNLTFGELFDYEFPLFPETTEEDRHTLREMCELHEVISRQDVERELNVSSEAQIVQYIFCNGATVLPVEVFRDVVASLDMHPQVINFAPTFINKITTTGKGMQPLILHLITLIAVLAICPLLVVSEHIELHENILHWLNNDWTMGCPDGGAGNTSVHGCNLLWRNFLTSSRPASDGLRYLRRELVQFFWRQENRSIADVPVGGVWPVGALVIRHVSDGIGGNSGDESRCQAMNLTTRTAHWEVPMVFGCGHEWAITVPFSLTREEALAKVSSINLPQNTTASSAIIAHFSGYNPSAGLLVHAKIFFSFPAGGGMMPRFYVSPIDPTTWRLVTGFFVLKLLGTCFFVYTLIAYGVTGLPWLFDLLEEIVQLTLLVGSFIFLLGVREAPDDLTQTSHAPKNFDLWAERYDNGMTFLGFFAFFFVTSTIKFTPHVRGFQLLSDILRTVFFEIVGLIIMFIIWSFAFVCTSMIVFGDTVRTFSSMPSATRHLLFYFMNESDFPTLFENAPIAGPLFFFAYQLFVVFFALNLLIAVLTSPLVRVKSRNELQHQAFAKVNALVSEAGWRASFKMTLDYYLLWPMLGVLYDCTPITQRTWVKLHKAVMTLYQTEDQWDNDLKMAKDVLRSAAEMVAVIERGAGNHDIRSALEAEENMAQSGRTANSIAYMQTERHLWSSPLVMMVVDERIIHNDIALAIVLTSIASESKYNTVRDARLMTALKHFDEFEYRLSMSKNLQESLEPAAEEHAQSLSDRLAEQRLQHGDFGVPAASFRFGWSAFKKNDGSESPSQGSNFGNAVESVTGDETGSQRSLPVGKASPPGASPSTGPTKAFGSPSSDSPPLGAIGREGGALRARHDRAFDEKSVHHRSHGGSGRDTSGKYKMANGSDTDESSLATTNRQQHQLASTGPSSFSGGGEKTSTASNPPAAGGSLVMKTADGMGYNLSGREYEFTLVIRNKLANATQLLFYSLTAAGFSVYFFSPFFVDVLPSAFLTYSLHAGLRDEEIITECYDERCLSGWSMNKTMNQVGDIGEYYMWLDGVLGRQLFARRRFPSLPGTVDPRGVFWDPSIVHSGPINFRQLRSIPQVTCEEESYAGDIFGPIAARAGFPCKSVPHGPGKGWERGLMMPKPGRPGLDQSAYIYRTDCAEIEPKVFIGLMYDYPCEGYQVNVNNYSEFRQVVDSGWFDNFTKLATVTTVFDYGPDESVEYTMHIEFGENGGGAFGRAFAFTARSSARLFNLDNQRIGFQVMLCVDLLWSILLFARYGYHRYTKRGRQAMSEAQVAVLRPNFPTINLILFFLVFVVINIVLPEDEQPSRHTTAQNVCAILYLTYKVTHTIIFPAASLLSRQVRVLILTIENAVLQIIKVIPYFVVFIWGFLLCGYLVFGRIVPSFGRLRWALMNIGITGFGGGFEYHTLHNARFIEAVFYSVLFFCVVLVVLSNLFLAMVTSASGDAQTQAPCVAHVEGVLYYHKQRVMYGKFLTGYLATTVYAIEAKLSGGLGRCLTPKFLVTPHKALAAVMHDDGRLSFPSEVLTTTMSPLRVNGILRAMHYRDLNERAFAALMPFILSNYVRFQATHPFRAARDAKMEGKEEHALMKMGVSTAWGTRSHRESVRLASASNSASNTPQQANVDSLALVRSQFMHQQGRLPVPGNADGVESEEMSEGDSVKASSLEAAASPHSGAFVPRTTTMAPRGARTMGPLGGGAPARRRSVRMADTASLESV